MSVCGHSCAWTRHCFTCTGADDVLLDSSLIPLPPIIHKTQYPALVHDAYTKLCLDSLILVPDHVLVHADTDEVPLGEEPLSRSKKPSAPVTRACRPPLNRWRSCSNWRPGQARVQVLHVYVCSRLTMARGQDRSDPDGSLLEFIELC